MAQLYNVKTEGYIVEGILVTVNDVVRAVGCSLATARRRLKEKKKLEEIYRDDDNYVKSSM